MDQLFPLQFVPGVRIGFGQKSLTMPHTVHLKLGLYTLAVPRKTLPRFLFQVLCHKSAWKEQCRFRPELGLTWDQLRLVSGHVVLSKVIQALQRLLPSCTNRMSIMRPQSSATVQHSPLKSDIIGINRGGVIFGVGFHTAIIQTTVLKSHKIFCIPLLLVCIMTA